MIYELGIVIKTTMVLACAGLLSLALSRASASARHLVWAIGLCAALILPIISAMIPSIELPVLPQQEERSIPKLIPSASHEGNTHAATSLPPPNSRTTPNIPNEALAAPAQPGNRWMTRELFAMIWTFGALLVLVRALRGFWDVRRLQRNSTPVADESWDRLVARLQGALSVRRPVELRIGGDGVPPLTWGIFRYVILLPATSRKWSPERRQVVLAHEMAHIGRKDGLMQILVHAACSIYWFSPMVWYAAHRLRIEREQACDDRVLNLGADADDYAAHLLQIARDVNAGVSFAALSIAHPSQLESRLLAILNPSTNRKALSRLSRAGLFAVFVLLAGTVASIQVTALARLTLPALTPSMTVPAPSKPEPASLAATPPSQQQNVQQPQDVVPKPPGLLDIDIHTDYARIADDQVLVPITVQIALKDLSFKAENGIYSDQVHYLGSIKTVGGKVVGQPFEGVGEVQLLPAEYNNIRDQKRVYQNIQMLRPGLYRLDLVVKDMNSGNTGLISQRLEVPHYAGQGFSLSSLILADLVQPIATGKPAGGAFTIGSMKVVPNVKSEFLREQNLSVWVQAYNLRVDELTHKPSATVEVLITRNGNEVNRVVEESPELLSFSGQMTVSRTLSLQDFEPGAYQIQLIVTDRLTKEVQSATAQFSVRE
jgi:beta-lactamase regulating signal transducer with metallopeptidase domain